MQNSKNENPDLKEYLEWDYYTWSKALILWRSVLAKKKSTGCKALEIGGKNGGLSLFLAKEFSYSVTCSDINLPTENAVQLHKKYGIQRMINYAVQDVSHLEFDDNTFDVVMFKSVLGSVGKNDNMQKQQKAINEMHRVLKPGGVLLFAENAKASIFHETFRKIFRKWANYWRYISTNEIEKMLEHFSEKKIMTAGFLSVFASNYSIKKILYYTDNFLEVILPEKSRYVIYGYAIK